MFFFVCRLQVVSASVDELTCRFVDVGGRKHVIHATLTETYPNTPPVWFSESEEPKVSEAVSCLASTSGLDNHLLYQVRLLLTNLCNLFSIPGNHIYYCILNYYHIVLSVIDAAAFVTYLSLCKIKCKSAPF